MERDRQPPEAPRRPAVRKTERMWPLDVGLLALAGLVYYSVASHLSFEDPRPLHNAWTYAIGLSLAAVVLAAFTRVLASRFLHTSIQIGVLFSVFAHLSLLLLAVNVVVFQRYFPDALTGAQPAKAAVNKTVPDYLFATPTRSMQQPDWSRPTDAETASPVEPVERRHLPPLDHSAVKLEMPTEPIIPKQRELEKFLIPRQQPESAMPAPANSPGRRARSVARSEAGIAPTTPPQAIEVPAQVSRDRPLEVSVEPSPQATRRVTSPTVSVALAAPNLPPEPMTAPTMVPLAGRAKASNVDELPLIGQFGSAPQRPLARQPQRSPELAGSAPAPTAIPIARNDAAAERMLAPLDIPLVKAERNVGASVTTPTDALPIGMTHSGMTASAAERSISSAASGMPSVEAGSSPDVRSRRRSGETGLPLPLGNLADTSLAQSSMSLAASSGLSIRGESTRGDDDRESTSGGEPYSEVPLDRLQAAAETAESIGQSPLGNRGAASAVSSALDDTAALPFDLPLGIDGLADSPATRAGVTVSLDAVPEPGAWSLRPSQRKRMDVGGPVTPAGTTVAAVESFRRRVMRTQGGAAAAPPGLIGPATEEAIEQGLAYLASRQESSGEWSLQGQGERVLLQSDTAATGLCVLAFQGAGYTHRQHQYAGCVYRGLAALIAMQQRDGNLYRSENPLSDQNVAFYSHGIAALALCEAYGMSRDESLRAPAQAAIDYIVATQHRERGGWRYQPQISSDTSVSGWMMMALKSGELAGLAVPQSTYEGINRWLEFAKPSRAAADRYRYNPFAPDTPSQRHGREVTPTMTAVGMLMRIYGGWKRDHPAMRSAADYLATYPPAIGDRRSPQRDTYYWYYATQVMFHMGGEHWENWNSRLSPILVEGQIKSGPHAGSWDPMLPVPDRWSPHAGRLYLTTMNLLSLEVYYRHLPIYENAVN